MEREAVIVNLAFSTKCCMYISLLIIWINKIFRHDSVREVQLIKNKTEEYMTKKKKKKKEKEKLHSPE